jgi:Toprim domain
MRRGGLAVSRIKDFLHFCQENDLDPDARSTHEAFDRGGVIEAWWNEAVPVPGSSAERYLRRRAIHELPPNVDDVLRWHPACPFGGGRFRVGCMLALYRDVRTDAAVAIHRTYFTDVGAARRMSLGPIARAMVKLWPLVGDLLVVGEGLETVLSAASMRWRGTPLQPAWAGTVANNVAGLPVIKGVKRLIILGDNDETGTGRLKAMQAYHRWKEAGRDALILMPNRVGIDFNDIARGRRHGSK